MALFPQVVAFDLAHWGDRLAILRPMEVDCHSHRWLVPRVGLHEIEWDGQDPSSCSRILR